MLICALLSTIETNTSIYKFTFELNNKKGYSIVSGDERFPKVFAYTEEGQISDTIYNKALATVIKNIPLSLSYGIEDYYTINKKLISSRSSLEIDTKGPHLNTRWGQDYPYNANVPLACNNLSSSYRQRAPIGCGAIAAGQAVAYVAPSAIRDKYDLYTIREIQNAKTVDSQTMQKISTFLYDMASFYKAKFSCSGTSTSTKDILYKFDEWNIAYSYNSGNLDNETARFRISGGYVIMARGETSSTAHIWIYDGVKYSVLSPTSIIVEGYHCNWGWRGSQTVGTMMEHGRILEEQR